MPPARRPPAGKATVAGAPVDPAIISSQVARSEVRPQSQTPIPLKPVESNVASTRAPGNDTPPDTKSETTKEESTPNPPVTNSPRPVDASKVPAFNSTANFETEVRDAFQKFATVEKSRVAEDRRKRIMQDQKIKLNDLMKFSKNFKLHTPVPKDLVPILAKDSAKQNEIVKKAQREAEQKATSPSTTLKAPGDQALSAKHDGTRAPPNTATAERPEFTQARQVLPPRGPHAGLMPRDKLQQFSNVYPPAGLNNQGMLSHRLADHHGRHKAGMAVPVPAPLPIHNAQKPPSRSSVNAVPLTSSQASSTVRTPTSAVSTKFNVNARDFKPNPAANTFKPTGAPSTTSSPKSGVNVRPVSRDPIPGDFFGKKKPLPPGEKPSILEHFNPLKRLKEKAQNENKVKDYAANGGIVYAHATPVTWTQMDVDNPEKNYKYYKDMFETPPQASSGTSPQPSTASPVNPALLHQLPPHLQHVQQIPHVQIPQQTQYQGPTQPHHYPGPGHYDDHRMRSSPAAASAFSTPRMQAPYLAYPQAIGQPIPYPAGQPMPPYPMGPGVQQPQHFRQYHSGGPFPQSPGQQFAAPIMVQNSSQGGYMAPHPMSGPQVHMFPPGQMPPYAGQSQPPSGYPSPGRATPMMQQGSYQGQNPPIYMNGQQYSTPVYAQQPPQHCEFLPVPTRLIANSTMSNANTRLCIVSASLQSESSAAASFPAPSKPCTQ